MPDQPLEESLRRIIREEMEAVEQRLGSLEKHVADGFGRMDEKFVWTEERFDWVGQRFDAINAAMGIYITLDPVTTAGARKAVANEGTVEVGSETYRRIQLWSIAEYFDGRPPQLPHMNDPRKGKPMPEQTELLQ